jgi:hypothetical protein
LAHQDEDLQAHRPDRLREPLPERTFWQRLPRRNFRHALFLLAALLAIVAIKRMGGGVSLAKLFNDIAGPPAPTQQKQQQSYQHLEVKPR